METSEPEPNSHPDDHGDQQTPDYMVSEHEPEEAPPHQHQHEATNEEDEADGTGARASRQSEREPKGPSGEGEPDGHHMPDETEDQAELGERTEEPPEPLDEPRITHTGSKYLNDPGSEFDLQQSMAGYEVESVTSIFKLFDHQNNGTIRISDIGEILRCLNFNPTEAEVSEFIKEVTHDEPTVNMDSLVPRVVELMESGKYQPAAEEELLAAFCTLDPDLTGFLTVKQLRDALTAFGEPLNDDEFDDLVKFAPIDPKNGKVNYREYAKELCMMK